ncbi:hypothetical protein EON62_03535 [archaeon]|nr:MAG: hypothetical protein EON62_03535 [archaeon]
MSNMGSPAAGADDADVEDVDKETQFLADLSKRQQPRAVTAPSTPTFPRATSRLASQSRQSAGLPGGRNSFAFAATSGASPDRHASTPASAHIGQPRPPVHAVGIFRTPMHSPIARHRRVAMGHSVFVPGEQAGGEQTATSSRGARADHQMTPSGSSPPGTAVWSSVLNAQSSVPLGVKPAWGSNLDQLRRAFVAREAAQHAGVTVTNSATTAKTPVITARSVGPLSPPHDSPGAASTYSAASACATCTVSGLREHEDEASRAPSRILHFNVNKLRPPSSSAHRGVRELDAAALLGGVLPRHVYHNAFGYSAAALPAGHVVMPSSSDRAGIVTARDTEREGGSTRGLVPNVLTLADYRLAAAFTNLPHELSDSRRRRAVSAGAAAFRRAGGSPGHAMSSRSPSFGSDAAHATPSDYASPVAWGRSLSLFSPAARSDDSCDEHEASGDAVFSQLAHATQYSIMHDSATARV